MQSPPRQKKKKKKKKKKKHKKKKHWREKRVDSAGPKPSGKNRERGKGKKLNRKTSTLHSRAGGRKIIHLRESSRGEKPETGKVEK